MVCSKCEEKKTCLFFDLLSLLFCVGCAGEFCVFVLFTFLFYFGIFFYRPTQEYRFDSFFIFFYMNSSITR